MEGLRDIKNLIYIEDYTLYIFLFSLLVFLIVLYFLTKKLIYFKRVVLPVKVAKKALKNLDLTDSKKASYKLTKYGKILKNEDFEYLKKYKYKQIVFDFSDEDLDKIREFLDGI